MDRPLSAATYLLLSSSQGYRAMSPLSLRTTHSAGGRMNGKVARRKSPHPTRIVCQAAQTRLSSWRQRFTAPLVSRLGQQPVELTRESPPGWRSPF